MTLRMPDEAGPSRDSNMVGGCGMCMSLQAVHGPHGVGRGFVLVRAREREVPELRLLGSFLWVPASGRSASAPARGRELRLLPASAPSGRWQGIGNKRSPAPRCIHGTPRRESCNFLPRLSSHMRCLIPLSLLPSPHPPAPNPNPNPGRARRGTRTAPWRCGICARPPRRSHTSGCTGMLPTGGLNAGAHVVMGAV